MMRLLTALCLGVALHAVQTVVWGGDHVRMEVTSSVLSLTAGLDTRTVFTTLADQNRLVPAVTMSGVNRSLDARAAARLCRAYGVSHSLVTIGDRFARGLADYVQEASRLSGGLASLRQAPEVYLYHQLGGSFDARISGNLGNQVGRGGTEGVSTRRAELGILSPALRDASTEAGHWLLRQLYGSGMSAIEFILQQEIPFSSVGNFSIGNHFAVQKSPYADRALVETLSMRPVGGSAPSGSLIKMRLRDLKHRFFGEPESTSFQRSLLQRWEDLPRLTLSTTGGVRQAVFRRPACCGAQRRLLGWLSRSGASMTAH